VYRITNVRVNAAGLGAGLAGTTPVNAFISISGSTSLPINNPQQIVGFVQSGFASAPTAPNADFAQCDSPSDELRIGGGNPGGIRFIEGFATAFKTRVAVTAGNSNGQAGDVLQNVPGTIYNSESGFITPAVSGAGLASYGTRLKAVFSNIPSTVRIFVTTTNIRNGSTLTAAPANLGTYAQLVISESAQDLNNQAPVVASNADVNSGNTLLWEVPLVNGAGTAVWEIIQSNPAQQDSAIFGVYTRYTANPGSNLPTPGTGRVNLSFAPTSTSTSASSSLLVPRFADTSSGIDLITIEVCRTALLFPFVTSAGGFDTGIAIANTTTDPFGTRNQSGTCALNFYGATPNPPVFTTASVPTGTVYSDLVSARAGQNFTGYMIAVCNFQLAHGFAFVSDIGARNLAMGYLALVLDDPADDRNNINESLGQ
jgi:hypothetical protein